MPGQTTVVFPWAAAECSWGFANSCVRVKVSWYLTFQGFFLLLRLCHTDLPGLEFTSGWLAQENAWVQHLLSPVTAKKNLPTHYNLLLRFSFVFPTAFEALLSCSSFLLFFSIFTRKTRAKNSQLTFLERGMMVLGRTSRRFLQLRTGRVRAATHVPSEGTRDRRCFLCRSSSASWPSPWACSARPGCRLSQKRGE